MVSFSNTLTVTAVPVQPQLPHLLNPALSEATTLAPNAGKIWTKAVDYQVRKFPISQWFAKKSLNGMNQTSPETMAAAEYYDG